MAPNWSQFDREEADIDRRLDEGLITPAEAAKEHRELQRDMQGAMEEAHERARQDVDAEWGRW